MKNSRSQKSKPMLEPGTLAPDFELSCTPDQQLKLSELRDKKIILAFYPQDLILRTGVPYVATR